jgi:beta-lactamase superfamily II metal-dependent hydrolase
MGFDQPVDRTVIRMALEVQFLNARQGDAIWIRWGTRQIMIDMGTRGTGRSIAQRLRDLPEDRRRFDLLVVTHVDVDHIGGVLSCVADPAQPVPGLTFNDVWFNGWKHLSGETLTAASPQLEAMGGAQGEVFSNWLHDQPWNEAFGRGPVVRSDPTPIDIGDRLSLTVLGPGQRRLEALKPAWEADVAAAIDRGDLDGVSPGLEPMGPSTPPVFEDRTDLMLLAEAPAPRDDSPANGSSITLLLEWESKRILLTGDAFAAEIGEGLAALGGGHPVALDLIKTPHHGSRNNITRALVEAVDCPLWLFSSDGTTFRHPDAQAIATILAFGTHRNPTLAFNVRSKYSGWWDNDEWRRLFGYQVRYGTVDDGLTVRFDPG